MTTRTGPMSLGVMTIALLGWIGTELHLLRRHDDDRVAAAAAAARSASAASQAAAAKLREPCRGDCSSVLSSGGGGGIDDIFQAGTDQAIRDRIERSDGSRPRSAQGVPPTPASAPAPVATH
jgi:hypothetical protein